MLFPQNFKSDGLGRAETAVSAGPVFGLAQELIKRGGNFEIGFKAVNQAGAEKLFFDFSGAHQVNVLPLVPLLNFFRLGLV